MADDWFHDYSTWYEDEIRRANAARNPAVARRTLGSAYDFSHRLCRKAFADAKNPTTTLERVADLNSFIRTLCLEYEWLSTGRPYYRVYPDYAKVFIRTRLNVPLKFLRSPYQAQLVRFQHGNELEIQGFKVRGLFFGVSTKGQLLSPFFSFHDAQDRAADGLGMLRAQMTTPSGADITPALCLSWTPEQRERTVAEHMEILAQNALPGRDDSKPARRVLEECWRIAISVSFLAIGGDKLIEPDILNADFPAYLEAVNTRNRARVRELAETSVTRRNGRAGFAVGRADKILGRRAEYRPTTPDERDENCGTRGLSYRHQRIGHVRYLPRGDEWIGTWVRETTVRRDLPEPPDDARPGSRTLRSTAEQDRILRGD